MVDVAVRIRIKEARKEKEVSLRELSGMTGVSKTYLSDMENGKHSPSIYMLCLIAANLGVSLNTLFEYKIIRK